MMAIQILSDLHLESPRAYDLFDIVPRAPHLALLGDVGNVLADGGNGKDKGPRVDDGYFAFLTAQLRRFRTVLLVPGNHEAYGSGTGMEQGSELGSGSGSGSSQSHPSSPSGWPRVLDALRAFEHDVRADASLGEFVLLDRRAYRLPDAPDTVLLGCSLFSRVPPASRADVDVGLNDFYQTGGGWSAAAHDAAHARDLAWLNGAVRELETDQPLDVLSNAVILTHWCPSRDARALDPRHAGSPIASAFSTDLSGEPCFRSERVKMWAFGHTHYNCDFLANRAGATTPLRLLANQRGYYFAQARGFDGQLTVTLQTETEEHGAVEE